MALCGRGRCHPMLVLICPNPAASFQEMGCFCPVTVPPTATAPLEPILKPRPADESVIAAIKRLSQSYPMLDKAVLLNKTSLLMSEYMLRGRNKNEVIDELEAVFMRHYEEFIETQEI